MMWQWDNKIMKKLKIFSLCTDTPLPSEKIGEIFFLGEGDVGTHAEKIFQSTWGRLISDWSCSSLGRLRVAWAREANTLTLGNSFGASSSVSGSPWYRPPSSSSLRKSSCLRCFFRWDRLLVDLLDGDRVSPEITCCDDWGCNDRTEETDGSDGTGPYCNARINSAFTSATSLLISLTVCSWRAETSARSLLNLKRYVK